MWNSADFSTIIFEFDYKLIIFEFDYKFEVRRFRSLLIESLSQPLKSSVTDEPSNKLTNGHSGL